MYSQLVVVAFRHGGPRDQGPEGRRGSVGERGERADSGADRADGAQVRLRDALRGQRHARALRRRSRALANQGTYPLSNYHPSLRFHPIPCAVQAQGRGAAGVRFERRRGAGVVDGLEQRQGGRAARLQWTGHLQGATQLADRRPRRGRLPPNRPTGSRRPHRQRRK